VNDQHPSRTIHLLTNIWSKAETVIHILVGLTLPLAALGGLGQLRMSRIPSPASFSEGARLVD